MVYKKIISALVVFLMLLTCFPQMSISAAPKSDNQKEQKEQQKAGKAKLVDIKLDADSYDLTEGKTHNTIVSAVYSDGTKEDVTNNANFSSFMPWVAKVSDAGVVTGVKPGLALIVVKYKGNFSYVFVKVVPKVTSLKLDSNEYTLEKDQVHKTTVTAVYSDNTEKDKTSEAKYESSDPTIASVDSSGIVKGLARGRAVITVSYESVSSNVIVFVTDKSALAAKIAEADKLDESNYNSESWTVLKEALTAAKAVFDNKAATQEEIDNALSALTSAVDKLVLNWTLIWSDEFDKANGAAASEDKWVHETGNNGGWGNNELEVYTDSTDNVFHRDGNLVIKALQNANGQVTSGRIKTAGKFDMKYGRIDVRAKLPLGTGLWPAIWMMPADDVYGGWAASGEIDIMEAKGRFPEEVGGTLHYGGAWPNNKYSGKSYKFEDGSTIADFHTYSLEWEPGEIRWYVDGKHYQTQTNWYTANKDGEKYAFPAPFDQDFYVILNLAFGGNFDGGLSDPSKLPGEMVVDYVHAYKLTGRPYKTAADPLVTPDPLPEGAKQADSTGNLISNSDFSEPIVNNPEGLNDFGTAWNFVHIPGTAGNGTQSIDTIDGKNYAKIDISAPGTQNYAVQLIQRTTVGKGRWYKVSFDAKTSSSRKIDLKVGGGEDRGYTVYSDVYSYNLTDTFKHFESTFQMAADTDLRGRVEFELGLDANPVWIGNVRLEEIPAPEVDLNSSKTPLPVTGNHIYNGGFDKASVSRMTYWNLLLNGAQAKAYVPEDTRELNVDITEAGTDAGAITLDQRGIQLIKDGQYRLNFKARAAADRNIQVKLVSKDGTTSYVSEKNFALTSEMKTFELPFTMSAANDLESQLVFMLGGSSSKVFIDDVSLVKTNVDYTGVDLYPLKNGDFSLGYTGWEQFKEGADATFSLDNGEAKISAASVGANPWSIMLIQSGMNFTKNIEYVLSFDARASVNRDILVTMENASYARAFDSTSLQLTPQSKHFEFNVKPSVSESLALKFQMGRTSQGAAGDVYIDNVVLQVKNPPVKKAPMLIADDTDNMVGNAIDITTADDTDWRNAITTVKINDSVVDNSKYELTAGKISFTADNFPAAGKYTITVKAEGYADAAVVQDIYANDGKIVQNGTFDTNYDGWKLVTIDGSNAALSAENGELKVNFPNYDGWFMWSTQVYQDKLRLAAGKTYVIKFDARATMPKTIWLQLRKGEEMNYLEEQNIALTTSNQTFSYEVTMPVSDTNASLKFLLGSNNVPGEQFTTHSIYLDNISIEEKTDTPPVDTTIVKNGTFDTNYDGWTTYKADGSDAALSVENGELKVNFTNYDGWFRWSTQVYQDKLRLAAGKTYVIKFDARSTTPKNVLLEVNKGSGGNYYASPEIALTTSNKTFTYEFTPTDTDANAKLNFLLGSNNVLGENFVTHSIYLDNISIEEKVTTPPVDTSIVKNGTFDTNYDGWTTYKADGSDAALSVENGELKVNFPNYDGWFIYSTQVNQEKLNLAAGKTYVLKFDARATIAKNVQLELNKGAGGNYLEGKNIALTTSNQTFSYEFTTTAADANATLKFLLGSNNVPGPQFVTHSIYLDNISIEETTTTGGGGGGGTTEPSLITVEAENAATMDAGFTVGTDAGISYLTSSAAGTFSLDVNAPAAGTYKVTVYGKCTPAGVYYELRNSNNTNIGSIGWAPSTEWVQATFNATLAEGSQSLKLFCAAGAGSTVCVDKVTFELQK